MCGSCMETCINGRLHKIFHLDVFQGQIFFYFIFCKMSHFKFETYFKCKTDCFKLKMLPEMFEKNVGLRINYNIV